MESVIKSYWNNELKIKNKKLMYSLLQRKLLGNCFKIFKDEKELRDAQIGVCGIRSVGKPGLPCTPWIEPEKAFIEAEKIKNKYKCETIVCECDKYLPRSIQGELSYIHGQLEFYYTFNQAYMRQALKEDGKRAIGLEALYLLKQHLNESSFEDIQDLLQRFPNHVIELTCYKECLGWSKGRNYVIWEVRYY
jgi:hypothetical protein